MKQADDGCVEEKANLGMSDRGCIFPIYIGVGSLSKSLANLEEMFGKDVPVFLKQCPGETGTMIKSIQTLWFPSIHHTDRKLVGIELVAGDLKDPVYL